MGEPSLPASHSLSSISNEDLITLVRHQYPDSVIQEAEGKFFLITIHGGGDSARSAMEGALSSFIDMARDGRAIEQILSDIREDLSSPGMNRERHDSLMELLEIASAAVDGGVITNVVPWILVPSYTRQIEDLRRRVATRLGMTAQDMAAKEDAKRRAGKKFSPAERAQTDTYQAFTPAERIARMRARGVAV